MRRSSYRLDSSIPRKSAAADIYGCFSDLTGCGKTISAWQNLDGLHGWAKCRTLPQDAQNGQRSHPPNPGALRRALSHARTRSG